ncbi:hypothetical protein OIU74_008589 [Salix koriyanagi]|uniref:Uncharacterized protein n=1 Tax=Salix koriyanagi TaxID=2511006 RepID=A0A9Q0TQB1_9ROSI|nr:hypothetical protein OIU74_008589 [Salix koriyanagi]
MRTRHRPIRWFPSCPCTWPIRYKSRVDFSALTRTENAGLLKPQTCYAYPSLHDTWREGSRRWHMTKHLDFIRLHVTQVAQHRGWLGRGVVVFRCRTTAGLRRGKQSPNGICRSAERWV